MSSRRGCPRSPQNSCLANESPPSMQSSGGSCLADESAPSFNSTPSTQYISDISQPSLQDNSTSYFLNNTRASSCPSSPSAQYQSYDHSLPDVLNQYHSAMPSWIDVWTPQPRPKPVPLVGRASPRYTGAQSPQSPRTPQRQCPFTPNQNLSMQQADLFAEDLDGSVPDNFNQMHSEMPGYVNVWTPQPRPRPETLYDDRNRGYPPSPDGSPAAACSPFGGRAPPNSPAPEVPVRGPPTRPPSRNLPCPSLGDMSPLGNFTEDDSEEMCTPHATGRQRVPTTPQRSAACPMPALRGRSINMDDVSAEPPVEISSEAESSLHMRPYESLSVIQEDLSGERPSCGTPPYHSTPRRQSACPRPTFMTRSINMDDVSAEPPIEISSEAESSLHMRPYESLSVIQEDESGERPSVCRPPPRTTPRRPSACPRPAPTTCPRNLDFDPLVPYSTPVRAERSVDVSLPDPFNVMMSSMPSMLDVWTPQPRPPPVNLLANMDDLPHNLRMPLKAVEYAKQIRDMRQAEYEETCPNRFSGRRSCPGRPQVNRQLQNMNLPNQLFYTNMKIGNERVDDESMISMHSPGPELLSDVSAPELCNISSGPNVPTGRIIDISSPRPPPIQQPQVHPVLACQNIADESSPELCDMSIGSPLPPRTPYPPASETQGSASMNESLLDDSYKSILERFEAFKNRDRRAPTPSPQQASCERGAAPAGVKSAVKTTSTQIDGKGGVVTETIVERSAVENGELRTRTTHTISKEDAMGNVSSETIESTQPPSRAASKNQSRMSSAACPISPANNRSRMSPAACPTPVRPASPVNARRRLDFGNMTATNLADQSMPSFAGSPGGSPICSTRIQNLPAEQLSDVSEPSSGGNVSIPSPLRRSERWDNTSAMNRDQSQRCNATPPSRFIDPTLPFPYAASPPPAQCPNRRSQSLSRPTTCPSPAAADGRSQSVPRKQSCPTRGSAPMSPNFGHMKSSMPFPGVSTASPCQRPAAPSGGPDVARRYQALKNKINQGGSCPMQQPAQRAGSPSRAPSPQGSLIDVPPHSPYAGGPPQPPCATMFDISGQPNDSGDPFGYTGNYSFGKNNFEDEKGPYEETTINVEIKASKRSVRRGVFNSPDESDQSIESCD